jgi:hypothetical protein
LDPCDIVSDNRIEGGDLLDILEHPNPNRYAGQKISSSGATTPNQAGRHPAAPGPFAGFDNQCWPTPYVYRRQCMDGSFWSAINFKALRQ